MSEGSASAEQFWQMWWDGVEGCGETVNPAPTRSWGFENIGYSLDVLAGFHSHAAIQDWSCERL